MSQGMIGMAEIKLSEAEIEAAVAVLRSGQLRQGKQCEAFEAEFADYVGAEHALTCSNGSAAGHLVYMAAMERGQEVLVPAFTFIATASMPAYEGIKPLFCDIDPETFLIDLEHAESLITPSTRAISPVHLFGNACDVDAIKAFARKHDLFVAWDAAQAHGARYKGQDVGGLGDAAWYSFYPSKNMFVGEGGMITTPHANLDEKMRDLRSHGQVGKYYHTSLGLNYRMTDVEAAIGREQLKRLDTMLAVRRRNGAMLNEGLAGIPGLSPQKATPDSEHAFHLYCLRVEPDVFGMDRDALGERLKEQGIASGVHYPRGLHQQPVFEEMYGKTTLPETERLCAQILAIPVHHGLSEEQVGRIVEAVRKVSGV